MPGSTKPQHILTLARKLLQIEHVNVLRCFQVAECSDNLYFLYEYIVCRTLASAVYDGVSATWSLPEATNLARECSAAIVSGAGAAGLNHLDLSLDHVLLPMEPGRVGTRFAKIFGFGLCGVVCEDFEDKVTRAPELRRAYAQHAGKRVDGGGVVYSLHPQKKGWLDSWGLGLIIYTLLEGRLPFTQSAEEIINMGAQQLELSSGDMEARSVVEGLLKARAAERRQCANVLGSSFCRKYWCEPKDRIERVFTMLHDFCSEALPKRIFGRFLVQFLDDRLLRLVCANYYILDLDGDGIVSDADLHAAARLLHRSRHDASFILEHLVPENTSCISIWRYADTMAEGIIDGRALRLAFDSIDEDASQAITPLELFHALHPLCADLTIAQVVEHIEVVELVAAEDGASLDHTLDFDEFCRLFPQRTRRVKAMETRAAAAERSTFELRSRWNAVNGAIREWIQKLQGACDELACLKDRAIEKRAGEQARLDALDGLRSNVRLADRCCGQPPGPFADLQEMRDIVKRDRPRRRSLSAGEAKKDKEEEILLDFDSFLQHHAINCGWLSLLTPEANQLKKIRSKGNRQPLYDKDFWDAYQLATAVERMLGNILHWAKAQTGEYESFVDMLAEPESGLPALSHAGRGRPAH